MCRYFPFEKSRSRRPVLVLVYFLLHRLRSSKFIDIIFLSVVISEKAIKNSLWYRIQSLKAFKNITIHSMIVCFGEKSSKKKQKRS